MKLSWKIVLTVLLIVTPHCKRQQLHHDCLHLPSGAGQPGWGRIG